jgi:phosphotriesterase-related protein
MLFKQYSALSPSALWGVNACGKELEEYLLAADIGPCILPAMSIDQHAERLFFFCLVVAASSALIARRRPGTGLIFQPLRLASLCALALVLFSLPTFAVDDERVAQFRAANQGKIITVLGPIDAESAGITLPHEHFFLDLSLPFDDPDRWVRAGRRAPGGAEDRSVYDLELKLDNWAEVYRVLWRTKDPLVLDDFDLAVEEAGAFKAAGGATVIDVTSKGLGRDPERLALLARRSGLHIVMGTGWYREGWRPIDFNGMNVDELADDMVAEIVEGTGPDKIHAGVIGEIPAMDLATEPDSNDVKQLRAAARASVKTGAALTLHQWVGDGERLMKTLDILEAEGADLGRVIVGHVGGDAPDQLDILAAALARGVTLEFDLLGVAFLLAEKVSDTRGAADTVAALVKQGYSDQLLLSQDVCTKTQLKAYGGNGYDYVLTEVVPYLKGIGVTDEDVEKLLVANSARLFSIAP